jgi:Recombination endonuclease VII
MPARRVFIVDGKKLCPKCQQWLLVSSFNKNKTSSTGLSSWCRECVRINCRAWAGANRQRLQEYQREYHRKHRARILPQLRANGLRRLYGLTLEQYAEKLAAQKGVCACCGREPRAREKAFPVDHDHACCPGARSCGRCVRGIVCQGCNHLIGCLESPKRHLGEAYLRRFA